MEDVNIITGALHTGYISDVVAAASDQPLTKRPRLESHQPLIKALQTSKVTKNVADILGTFDQCDNPQTILIEGIGKSMLMKHIAYMWAIGEVMMKFQLLLLVYLRDPSVQKMSSLQDLLQSFCVRNMVLSKIEQCTESVSEDNGKALAILLDGYDEFPESLRDTSLIADIINRQVLPECGLIVSSRPCVSQHLHNKATLRVDILGFTETEREHFIKQSLNKQPHKISQLVSYLQDHMTISSLCFTPFNMLVLLFLHKQEFLPRNSTELYKLFICLTIRRHIAKCGNVITIRDLDQLPEPYEKVIKQLSKLSLETLNNNQLTFTLDQIKSYCPELEAIQGAINGFGLLQVIEHINLFDKTKTFNFIHFSVQEYLAAYYIANLPPDEEYSIIKEYFWSNIHYNMLNFYVTLTEGQHPAFKQFLCSGKEMNAIEDKLFEDERRCLRLYRVFKDTGDLDICRTIEGKFSNKEINLQGATLSPYNIEDLASLLTCSSCGNWKKINLYNSYIQDYGLRLLHCSLHHSVITIQELWLISNNLSSSSDIFLSDIIITCTAKVLSISENKGVGETQHFLTTILTDPSTVIEGLGMYSNNFSSTKWAIHLFSLLRENKTVNKLGQ